MIKFREAALGGVDEITGDDDFFSARLFQQLGDALEIFGIISIGNSEAVGAEDGRFSKMNI